jgi:uncharacterized protein YjbJ (UPF0337 family)
MNKNEIKRKVERAKGAVKEKAGSVADNPDLEAEGAAEHDKGAVREVAGTTALCRCRFAPVDPLLRDHQCGRLRGFGGGLPALHHCDVWLSFDRTRRTRASAFQRPTAIWIATVWIYGRRRGESLADKLYLRELLNSDQRLRRLLSECVATQS